MTGEIGVGEKRGWEGEGTKTEEKGRTKREGKEVKGDGTQTLRDGLRVRAQLNSQKASSPTRDEELVQWPAVAKKP